MRDIRFTIKAMCVGIALLAIDIAIWKADLSASGPWLLIGMRGTLIATSVFAFTVLFLLRGQGSRPFLAGFLAVGFCAELAYWICCWLAPWQVLAYTQNPVDHALIVFYFHAIPGLEQALLRGSPTARLFFEMTCFPLIVTIHSLPVMSVAVIGAWAWKKRAIRCDRPGPIIT